MNAAVNQQNADVQPQNQTLAATEPVKQNPANTQSAKAVENKIKVTFIELGSVNCIPCRMMQPVMKQIEEKYKDKVKIIFYDVWTQEGQPFGQKYGIQAIP
ncbi:thioredoxin family protein, partial [Candidatus Dependentiae bacterium]|nr:thioredoxin family protein [Candidatus Dependentiae bacterium]